MISVLRMHKIGSPQNLSFCDFDFLHSLSCLGNNQKFYYFSIHDQNCLSAFNGVSRKHQIYNLYFRLVFVRVCFCAYAVCSFTRQKTIWMPTSIFCPILLTFILHTKEIDLTEYHMINDYIYIYMNMDLQLQKLFSLWFDFYYYRYCYGILWIGQFLLSASNVHPSFWCQIHFAMVCLLNRVLFHVVNHSTLNIYIW